MEFGGIIFLVTDMVGKIIGTDQEIVIIGVSRVPRGVQVVIEAVELSNIPAVGAAAVTGDESAINAQLQGQTVQQKGVSLTDAGTVNQTGISGVLELVRFIFQIVVIVSNIGTDVIVDGLQLGIVVGIIDV